MSMIEQTGMPPRFASGDSIADCTVFGNEVGRVSRFLMLSGAAAAGVLGAFAAHERMSPETAALGLMAGLAFAGGLLSTWSPCGYSSLCLLRPRGKYTARNLLRWTPGFVIHGLGYALGAVILGVLLGGLGQVMGFRGVSVGAMTGIGAAAVFYGAHQLRLVRAPYPQRRAQVPHDARQRYPMWAVCALYGLSLGLNYLTYVQTPILYLVTASAVVFGNPLAGVAIFALFNLGRFLPMLAQIRAHQKLGTAVMFKDVDTELKHRIDSLIQELEDRITRAIASDERLSETAGVLRSIPGIGPVASTMLIAEMPEIGTITGEQAAALTGLAPVAHDSGTLRGKRAIAGGRRALRHVMFQAALVAAHHNPSLRSFADRLRKAGKPHKVIITAIARKLVTIANTLCKSRQKWTAATA